ncbi:hypothetical protein RJT34_22582 [Clitoria ternatea]|uniref:Uncharacterized protein n=1 Tax=Clitoria ternatea TaxID=43366 RepID=A0AAN9IFP9_CLITE
MIYLLHVLFPSQIFLSSVTAISAKDDAKTRLQNAPSSQVKDFPFACHYGKEKDSDGTDGDPSLVMGDSPRVCSLHLLFLSKLVSYSLAVQEVEGEDKLDTLCVTPYLRKKEGDGGGGSSWRSWVFVITWRGDAIFFVSLFACKNVPIWVFTMVKKLTAACGGAAKAGVSLERIVVVWRYCDGIGNRAPGKRWVNVLLQ